MSDTDEIHDISTRGEAFSSELSITWIDPGRIEAGEMIAPAKLASEAAQVFAALHLVLGDLSFAVDCLAKADEAGIPDDKNLQSKALIFSGVVGYARCFKTGVRSVKLDPVALNNKGVSFDEHIHEYLISLRDKHVAHSVNDFEDCQAVAVMIGTPAAGWRDGSGVGVVIKQTVGISRALLRRAIAHIEVLKRFVESEISAQRLVVYSEFREYLAKGGKLEMAPIVKLSDRASVSQRRK